MKRPIRNHRLTTGVLLLVLLPLILTGCAAPQASGNLEQRLAELLKAQQQQAMQLERLQQQLDNLTSQPLVSSEVSVPNVDSGVIQQSSNTAVLTLPVAASAEEIAALSDAAALYLEAFAAIATGQMSEAENGFKRFIKQYPEHKYVGNANYWLAESLLSQKKSDLAEKTLLSIIENEKYQHKAPAAMARLVNYYLESDAQQSAAAMLQRLTNIYPESPELKRLMRSTELR